MQTYEEKITSLINGVVNSFIDDVSSKYNLPKEDLNRLWMKTEDDKCSDNVEKDVDYSSMKKPELVKVCKELGISDKGNKKDLIARIEKKKTRKETIVEKLNVSLNSIIIKKNKFGNYIHTPTKFVFNKDTKSVIGKEDDDGNILQLTQNDINICNKYKFKYVMPDDLNNNNNDEEIEDEIIDDESEEEDEEDEEDEEEEDED